MIPDFWSTLESFRWTFSILIMSQLRCGDQNCIECSRCTWTEKKCVEWQHHFSVLILEISGIESEYPIGSFAAFLCLLLPLEVFGGNDSKISLLFSYWKVLVGHGVVAIYIVVSNVHHCICAFPNIKLHLPIVDPIIRLVDVFLKLYIMSSG